MTDKKNLKKLHDSAVSEETKNMTAEEKRVKKVTLDVEKSENTENKKLQDYGDSKSQGSNELNKLEENFLTV